MKNQLFTLILAIAGTTFLAAAEDDKAEVEVDPVTGMVMAENWELTRTHCTVCHSPKQYLQPKGRAGHRPIAPGRYFDLDRQDTAQRVS